MGLATTTFQSHTAKTKTKKHIYPPKQTNKVSNKEHNANNIYIATFNVRTLRTDESLVQLELAMENIKCHIIGLSEVRRVGEEILERSKYIFFYKGETKGMFGVGFLIKKELRNDIEEFIGISERVAVLNINIPGSGKWSVIQVYAPTNVATQDMKNSFYRELTIALENTHKNKILMGDFNSTLGDLENNYNNRVGKYTTGKINDNGNRLIDFATENRLYILNTFFKKHFNRKWTWISPKGIKDERDFILSNNKNNFLNIEIVNKLDFNSDHRLLRAKLLVKTPRHSRKHIKSNRIQIPQSIPEEYGNTLSEELAKTYQVSSIQDKYNILEKGLKELSNKFRLKTEKKDKIGPEASNLITLRRALFTDRTKK